jgi:hypothetical protein
VASGLPLTDWHRAGVSPHTSPCGLAETCVFGKQSVGPVPAPAPSFLRTWSAPGTGPLLPKLRGQVAEFLSRGSPGHLTTVVATYQCRYAVRAPRPCLEAFRAGRPHATWAWVAPRPRIRRSPDAVPDLPGTAGYQLRRSWPADRSRSPPGSPHRSYRGTVGRDYPPVVHQLRSLPGASP